MEVIVERDGCEDAAVVVPGLTVGDVCAAVWAHVGVRADAGYRVVFDGEMLHDMDPSSDAAAMGLFDGERVRLVLPRRLLAAATLERTYGHGPAWRLDAREFEALMAQEAGHALCELAVRAGRVAAGARWPERAFKPWPEGGLVRLRWAAPLYMEVGPDARWREEGFLRVLQDAADGDVAAALEVMFDAGYPCAAGGVDARRRTRSYVFLPEVCRVYCERRVVPRAVVDTLFHEQYHPEGMGLDGASLLLLLMRRLDCRPGWLPRTCEIARTLLAAGARADYSGEPAERGAPLHALCKCYAVNAFTHASCAPLEAVRCLVEGGARVGKVARRRGTTALHAAVQRWASCAWRDRAAWAEVVLYLIDAAASWHAGARRMYLGRQDRRGNTPLHYAARLRLGRYSETARRRPRPLALTTADTRILDALRSGIAVRNRRGMSPLAVAALHGHTAVVDNLLAHGASVDTPDYRGRRPLYYAVASCRVQAVRALLRAGAAVDRAADGVWLPGALAFGTRPGSRVPAATWYAQRLVEELQGADAGWYAAQMQTQAANAATTVAPVVGSTKASPAPL